MLKRLKEWDRRLLLAPLCLVLAIGLRLPGIGNPPTDIHHVAQSESASVARNMARFGTDLWAPRVDWRGAHPATEEGGFPLFEALCALGWRGGSRLGELQYAWARGLSCFGWLLGLLALVAWVRRRLPGPALVYLLLYLFSPLMVAFSRNIQPDVLALGLLLLGLERIDSSRGGGRARVLWLVLGAASAGLGASMDGTLLPLLLLPLLGSGSPGWRPAVAVLFAALPPLVWFTHAGHLGDGAFLAALFGGVQSPWGGPASWFSMGSVSALGGTVLVASLSPLGILLLVLGGREVMQDNALWPFVWGAGLVVLSGLVFTAAFSLRSFELLPLVPFISVLMGPGLLRLLRPSPGGRLWATRGLAFLLFLGSCWLGGDYIARATERDRRVELVGHIVSAAVLAESPIVVSDRHPQSLLFSMDRRGWHRGDLSIADLSQLEQAGARFLLITDHSPAWTNRPFRSQLEETRRVVARSETFILVGLRGPSATPGVSGVPGLKQ